MRGVAWASFGVLGAVAVAVVVATRPTGSLSGLRTHVAGAIQRVVTLSGSIVPTSRTVVHAPISARIARVFVSELSLVKKGQPLLEFESQRLRTEALRKRLALLRGREQLATCRDGSARLCETEQVSLELAELEYRDSVLQQQSATLRSPADGLVWQLEAVAGATTALGMSGALATIVSGNQFSADVEGDETQTSHVSAGMPVTVSLELDLSVATAGIVASEPKLRRARNSMSGLSTFGVLIHLTHHDQRLRIGATVRADVVSEAKRDAVLVPNAALFDHEQQMGALVETHLGIEFRPVTIGLDDGTLSEVAAGIREGERVVVESRDRLRSMARGGRTARR